MLKTFTGLWNSTRARQKRQMKPQEAKGVKECKGKHDKQGEATASKRCSGQQETRSETEEITETG